MKAGWQGFDIVLITGKVELLGRVVLGAVQGDLHDIGKNSMGMILEGTGFQVLDLACGCAASALGGAVSERDPDFVGMSAFLATAMPAMRESIETLEGSGYRFYGGDSRTSAFYGELRSEDRG